MSCTIHTVTFDHDPIWTDRNKYVDAVSEVSAAINGSEIVVSSARGAQYPITLESTQDTGWLKGSTVVALRALSAVPSAYYTLTLNGTSYTVRFCNEQSGGAVQMQTVLQHSNPGSSDYYFGTIYLMAVA